ncbi:hypothetical protein TRVL_10235 [Trypanosoma vivax]|nr:hypothetical protein TRVL_10235 [Trypanosoma vivax]
MCIYVNSALVLLALLPLKICAATDTVVLGPRATVMLENCSCGDNNKCQSPQHDGFTVNCSTIQTGLTLKGCGDNTGGSPGKCYAVGGEENKILTGCNFSSEDALKNGCQYGTPPCTFRLSDGSKGGCGGRKIKLASLNGNCNFFCGFISGENRTNEQQQQSGQHENSSNASDSSRGVARALKASPGGSPAASKSNGDSSHSTSRGPESSERDGTSEKLSASISTTTPRKNNAQNEGAELGAMKVVVKCAAASLFIFYALF